MYPKLHLHKASIAEVHSLKEINIFRSQSFSLSTVLKNVEHSRVLQKSFDKGLLATATTTK